MAIDDDEKAPGAKAALDRHYAALERDGQDDDELDDDELEGDEPEGEEGDDQGDDDQEGEEDQEGDEPEGDPDLEGEERGEAEGERPGAAAAGAPAAEAGKGDDWQPYTLRAGGRLLEVPGAMLAEDGLFIPKEQVAAITETLQRGIHHNSTWQQELAERELAKAAWDPDFNERVVEAETMLKFLEPHLKDPESAQAFLEHYGHHMEVLSARVEAAKERAKAGLVAKYPALGQPRTEPTEEQFRELAVQALWAHFDDLLDRGEFRGVYGADERKALQTEIARNAALYVTTATHDDLGAGIKKGERAIDLNRLGEDIRRFGERTGRIRGGQPVRTAADRARRANQGARGQKRSPQMGARATGGKRRKSSMPKSRAEWEASMGQLVKEETEALREERR